jgi:glucose-6-phosphate dehydrogenase assembly protein OpcA
MTTTEASARPTSAEPVPLRDVEQEISRQMKELQGTGESPVLRARMSNLVIYCNSQESAEGVLAQIPGVVAIHPARVLLLVGEAAAPNRDITATVRVRAHGHDDQHQACSEEVLLHAGGAAVARLPFAVRALLIGDLPTNLWWAANEPPPLAGALLYELGEQAQQIVYDSLGWPEPTRGVAATATWLEQIERGADRWRVAADLNWRRLKYWRRLVAQALDPAALPGAVESVTEVLLEHGPHAVVQAWELASWLAHRLGWQVLTGRVQPGVELSWRFLAEHGDLRVRIHRLEQGPPEIRRLRIACTVNGRPGALNMAVDGEQRLAIVLEGVDAAPRTVTVPPLSPADVVGRQLSDRERDPVFRESMALAQSLAQSLLR